MPLAGVPIVVKDNIWVEGWRITQGSRLFADFIAPRDAVYQKVLSNVEEVKARGGRVIAVVTDGDTGVSGLAEHAFSIPETLELLTPVLSVLPLQLLAYYIAVRRGCDVDQPRNLAKSVTVE
jgi:glucosamine--fructose-6-phosphate aminotransferase (isomerizing)